MFYMASNRPTSMGLAISCCCSLTGKLTLIIIIESSWVKQILLLSVNVWLCRTRLGFLLYLCLDMNKSAPPPSRQGIPPYMPDAFLIIKCYFSVFIQNISYHLLFCSSYFLHTNIHKIIITANYNIFKINFYSNIHNLIGKTWLLLEVKV